MDISANITGISYLPFLCKELNEYCFEDLEEALSEESAFVLSVNKDKQFAISWWVSAKRTRSYPYARVYDTLGFSGKKVTVVPIFKDEGKEGDRDFLQWDTISLMSLLNVNVIISYYLTAKQSSRYENKITNQRFDTEQIGKELKRLLSYQSDALHWNLEQIDKVGGIGKKALTSYSQISARHGVEMHSEKSALKRINELLKGKENFMKLSRDLAEKAQKREAVTKQPKEDLSGEKAVLTIKNYLGGHYFFTADEARIQNKNILLIEGKHSKSGSLPSLEDIKDGLIKMVLFTNLRDVQLKGKRYNSQAVLKLTTGKGFDSNLLNDRQKKIYSLLDKEAEINGFKIEYA
jgi:hypothetical protein